MHHFNILSNSLPLLHGIIKLIICHTIIEFFENKTIDLEPFDYELQSSDKSIYSKKTRSAESKIDDIKPFDPKEPAIVIFLDDDAFTKIFGTEEEKKELKERNKIIKKLEKEIKKDESSNTSNKSQDGGCSNATQQNNFKLLQQQDIDQLIHEEIYTLYTIKDKINKYKTLSLIYKLQHLHCKQYFY